MADPKPADDAANLAAIRAELERRAAQPQPPDGGAATPAGAPDPALEAIKATLAARGGQGEPTDAPVPAPAGAPAQPGQVTDTGAAPVQGTLDVAGRVLKDVGVGVTEAPQAVVQGAVGAVKETAKAGASVADYLDKHVLDTRVDLGTTGNKTLDQAIGYVLRPLDAVSDAAGAIQGLVSKPTTITGGITESIAQFAVGMLGAGRVFKTVGIAAPTTTKGVIAQGMGKGAIADATVFDPLSERVSNIAVELGIDNQLTRYLMSKPGDTKAEGAFKNVLEGLMLGAGTETVLRLGAKVIKLAKHGDITGAKKAAIKFDDEFAKMLGDLEGPGAFEGHPVRPDEFAPKALADGTTVPTRLYADGRVLDGGEANYGVFSKAYSETHGGQHGAAVSIEINKPWRHDDAMPADEAAKIVEYFKQRYPSKAESFDSIFHRESAPGAFDRAVPGDGAHGVEPFSGQPGSAVNGGQFRDRLLSHVDSRDEAKEFADALRTLGYDAMTLDGPNGRAWLPLADQKPTKIVRESPATERVIDTPEVKVEAPPKAGDVSPQAKPGTPEPPRPSFSQSDAMVAKQSGQAATPRVEPRLADIPADAQERIVKALNSRWSFGKDFALSSDEFNMARLVGDDQDMHAAITAFTTHIGSIIDKQRGGAHRPHVDVEKGAAQIAEMVGGSADNVKALLAKLASSTEKLSDSMLALRIFMHSAVTQAAEKAAAAGVARRGADMAHAADVAAEAMQSAKIAAQLIAHVKGIQTNVARALSAQRIQVKPGAGYSFTQLREQLARTGISDADAAFLKQLSTLDDPKKLRRYLEASWMRKASDSFIEYYINALLSGPKTHIVQFVSNTASVGYAPMERMVAGFMPGGVGGREAVHRMVDEYNGLMMSLWDSVKVAGKALWSGKPILDEAAMSAAERAGTDRNAISAHRWGLSRDIYNAAGDVIDTETVAGRVLPWIVDGMGRMVNLPSRLLTTQDEFFKNLAYRSYVYSEAAAEARTRKLKGDDRAKFIAEKMDEAFEANGVGNNKEGLQRAREVTFTQDLEKGVGEWLQRGTGQYPLLRLVVPFVRTPTNLFRWTWQHTPIVNRLQFQQAADIAAGGQRAALARARTAMGSTFYLLAGYLAANNLVTGGGPLDTDLRRAKEATGWQPYSFRMPNGKYISFNRGDPFFMPLGLMADLHDMAGHMKDEKLDAIAGAMLTALAKNLSSKTYTQGITNLFDSIGDWLSGRSKFGVDTFAQRLAGNVLVPSVIANFKGEDEAMREVYSTMDAIRNRLPDNFLGLGNKGTKSLPAAYNIFGEKVDPAAFLGPDQWSPLAARDHKNDAVADQLVEVMMKVDHAFAKPSYLLGESKIDLRHVTTDAGQNAYERLNQLVGTVNGGVRQELEKLMRSRGYVEAGYGDRDFPMSPGSRLHQVGIVLQTYREAAKRQLLAENPKLLAQYRSETERSLTTGTRGTQPKGYTPPSFMESVFGK